MAAVGFKNNTGTDTQPSVAQIEQNLGGISMPEVLEIQPGRTKRALARQIEKLMFEVERDQYVSKRLNQQGPRICQVGCYTDKSNSLKTISGLNPEIDHIAVVGWEPVHIKGRLPQRLKLMARDYLPTLLGDRLPDDTFGTNMLTMLHTLWMVPATAARIAYLPIDSAVTGLRILARDKTIHYHDAVGKIQLASNDPEVRMRILTDVVQGLEEKVAYNSSLVAKLNELYEMQYGPSPEAITQERKRQQQLVESAVSDILGADKTKIISGAAEVKIENLSIEDLEKLHIFLSSKQEDILNGKVIDATSVDSRFAEVNAEILKMQESKTASVIQMEIEHYLKSLSALIEAKKTVRDMFPRSPQGSD